MSGDEALDYGIIDKILTNSSEKENDKNKSKSKGKKDK